MRIIPTRMRVDLAFKKYFLVLFLAFACFNFSLAQNRDISLLRKINSKQSPNATSFFKLSSNSGKYIPPVYPAFQFVLGKAKKNDTLCRDGWFSLVAFGATGAFTYGLKEIIQRPRPFVTYPDLKPLSDAGSFSFPSGHTSIAFCTATSISLYYKKWYIVVPAYAWAVSVAYSRMYLGVHYPTDIIGGIILGTGVPLLIHYWKPLNRTVDKAGRKLHIYK